MLLSFVIKAENKRFQAQIQIHSHLKAIHNFSFFSPPMNIRGFDILQFDLPSLEFSLTFDRNIFLDCRISISFHNQLPSSLNPY